MRVIVAVPELPYPPHKGTALRNFHLIRALAGHHQLRVLAAGKADPDARAALEGLGCTVECFPLRRRATTQRLRDLVASRQPDLARRLQPVGLVKRLEHLLRTGAWDILQVEGLELAELLGAARAIGTRTRLIYDAHNLEYRLQWRAGLTDLRRPSRWPWAAYSLIQALKLRRYEAAAARTADDLVAVSAEDARGLRRLTGRDVTILPNGIDCAYFGDQGSANRDRGSGIGDREAGAEVGESGLEQRGADNLGSAGDLSRSSRLVFCATFDYRPNVDAAVWLVRSILPRVWRHRPDVPLALVGRSPASAVRALASDRVEVTGYVPDIRPYVWASDLYVVPLRAGGGTRFKVLEGLAMGVPVLTTSLGAEGIGGRPGEQYLSADGTDEFADAILRALSRTGDLAAMVRRGRAFVETRYDWAVVTPRLLELYDGQKGVPRTAAV